MKELFYIRETTIIINDTKTATENQISEFAETLS